jgi:two-component system invasion response regulator UvrY
LRLVAQGKGESDIAKELGLSVKTVCTYKQRIFEKMGFESNADIYQYVFKMGWY